MGKRFWCVVIIVASVALETGRAGDRNVSRDGNYVVATEIRRLTAEPAHRGSYDFFPVTNVDSKLSRSDNKRDADKPSTERKKLTLFTISSKFGDIAVQPVVGDVKGAQLSLGF